MASGLCGVTGRHGWRQMSLTAWQDRPIEEARHFNPAYCGALVYEFVRSYEKARGGPVPLVLVFCALAVALHPATRERLPRSTITGLFPWLEDNSDVRVGFGDRARDLTPYVREALRFAAARQAICFTRDGTVATGPRRASFTPSALREMTRDVVDTVEATRRVARWFAAAGDPATILSGWGVKL